MATVNELITAIGFTLKPGTQSTISQIQQVVGGLSELGKNAITTGQKYAEQGHSLQVWAKNLGISVEEVQKWEEVAKRGGIEAEQMLSYLKELRDTNIPTMKVVEFANQLKQAGENAHLLKNDFRMNDEQFAFLTENADSILQTFREAKPMAKELVDSAEEAHKHFSSIEYSVTKVFRELGFRMLDKANPALDFIDKEARKEENKGRVAATALIATGALAKSTPVILNVLSKLPVIGGLIGRFTQSIGLAKAGTAAAGAAGGGAAAGAAGAGIALIFTKAIEDTLEAWINWIFNDFDFNKVFEREGGKVKFESGWDYVNFAKLITSGTEEILDPILDAISGDPTENLQKASAQYQDNRKTINVYVTTPAEVKDIIGDMGTATSTTPGGFAPLISQ